MVCFAKDMHSSDPFWTWPLKKKMGIKAEHQTKRTSFYCSQPVSLVFIRAVRHLVKPDLAHTFAQAYLGGNDISLQSS